MELKLPQQGSPQEKNLARVLLGFILIFWIVYLAKVIVFDPKTSALAPETTLGSGVISATPLPVQSAAKVTLLGSILPLLEDNGSGGTHRLVGADGKVEAILKSRNLDLNFTISGVLVEVTGKKERLVNDLPLINVESIRYRRND
ncbi:MAG: hypothetical protein AAB486_04405 [Patescibacteria group bacterium]